MHNMHIEIQVEILDIHISSEFDLLGPGGCWFSWQTSVTKSLNVSCGKGWGSVGRNFLSELQMIRA